MRKTRYVLTWIEYLSARIPDDIREEGRQQQMERELVVLYGLLPPDVDRPTVHTMMELAKMEGGGRDYRTLHDMLNAIAFGR